MKCSRSPHYLMAIVALALAVAGCAGKTARDEALTPVVLQAWPGVKADIQMGPNEPPATLPEFEAVLVAGDRAALAGIVPTHWNSLKTTAIFNIDAQSWSPGVKGSHKERILNFDQVLGKLVERTD